MLRTRASSWLLFALGVVACSSDPENSDNLGGQISCVDGQTAPCTCATGQQGTSSCVSGQWSTCTCTVGSGTGGAPAGNGGALPGSGGVAYGSGGISLGSGGIATGGAGAGGIAGAGGQLGSGGGATGGTSTTGGASNGGTGTSDGGATDTGGATGTGGALSSGGSTGTGGAGNGGAVNTGGTTGAGGAADGGMGTGGITGTGGTGTGGTLGTGGAGDGGALSTGGTGTGGSGGASCSGPPSNKLPQAPATCPNLATGAATINGTALHLWVGTKPGPVYFYWHATGQQYTEVDRGLPGVTSGVGTNGGIVASFDTTNGQKTNTGNNVWYTGDFDTADQILACAIKKGIVDPCRIYTAGYSAGGLQACAMVSLRSAYLAGAICYSGGAAVISGTPTDTSHFPPTLLAHGAQGSDMFIIDFAVASHNWENAYQAAGGFSVDCDDGGDHITSAFTRMGLDGHAMEFLNAHPYGVSPEPYAGGLPSGWPSYCHVINP